MTFTASAALGGRTRAPKPLQGSRGCGAQCPQQMPSWDRRSGLIHKLEISLQSFSSKSRCQARQGRQPAGTVDWRVHIAAQRPSVQLQLGGDATRTRTPCLLVKVEPTRLIINLLTAENNPLVLAVYWAGARQ